MTIIAQVPAIACSLGLNEFQLGDLSAIPRKHASNRDAMGFDNVTIMTMHFGPFEFPGVQNTLKCRLFGWKETGAGAGDAPFDIHIERRESGVTPAVGRNWSIANSGTLSLPVEDRVEQATIILTNTNSLAAGDKFNVLVRRPSAGSLAALAWLEWVAIVDET